MTNLIKEIEIDICVQNNVRSSALEIKHVQLYHHHEGNWIKLNCDGVYKKYNSTAGCGGIIIDSDDNWVIGYAQKIVFCDALVMEMWVMLHEIELPLQKRITNLVVISDSKVLVDMVNQDIRDNHNLLTLVHGIKRMT